MVRLVVPIFGLDVCVIMHIRNSGGDVLRIISSAVASSDPGGGVALDYILGRHIPRSGIGHGPGLCLGLCLRPSLVSCVSHNLLARRWRLRMADDGCLCVDLYMYNACAPCLLLSACMFACLDAHCLSCMRISGCTVVFVHMCILPA